MMYIQATVSGKFPQKNLQMVSHELINSVLPKEVLSWSAEKWEWTET